MIKIRREVKIGAVMFMALFLLIWGINYLRGTDIFSKQIIFYSFYEETNNLIETNPVSISGVQIGHVDKIFLHPDGSGNVVVKCIVRRIIDIPDNSTALMHSSSITGSRHIELILGDSSDKIESGDTLASKIQPGLQQEITQNILPLAGKIENILLRADTIITEISHLFTEDARKNLSETIDDLHKSMASIQQITHVADTTFVNSAAKLASIINNAESISANLEKNNETLTHFFQNLESITDTIASADVAQTINNANKTLESFSHIMEKIDRGEGSLGLLVNDDSLYINLSRTSKELELLLDDIRENPRKYINVSVFGRKD